MPTTSPVTESDPVATLNELILAGGDSLWSWVVLPVVALLGVYFTVRSGVLQFRMIPEMFRTLRDATPLDDSGKPQSVSSFQAFTLSAASRVGVGNIAGVGTAIAVGGPGAVFWMWLMAFIGGASSFIESTLAQLYKTRDADGFLGGPAYYMQRGLRSRWLGIVFAVILTVCFPLAFSSLQANTIQATIAGSVTSDTSAWLPGTTGVVLAIMMALVIFGGVRRIASVTQALVPLMALLYLLLGIIIVALNFERLPEVFASIFSQAFGPNEVVGATLGYIILTGVKRGMFSNEAGLGSAPNAGASAAVTHPVKQGLVQTLGVYFDTFLVCSITAFIILISVPDLAHAERGIMLTQNAVTEQLGPWAQVLLSIIVFLLAFSSIIGNYYYGQSNIEFITPRRSVLTIFRWASVTAVFFGSLVSADIIWNFADGAMGVMALINLGAITLLSGTAFALLRDYQEQRKQGHDPVFTKDRLPGLSGIEVWESVASVTGSQQVVEQRLTPAAPSGAAPTGDEPPPRETR